MADILPTDLFPGYTCNGSLITIPLTSLSLLTPGTANAATGDGRELIRAFNFQAKAALDSLPSSNKPTKLTIHTSTPSGVNATTIRQVMTISYDLAVSPLAISISSES